MIVPFPSNWLVLFGLWLQTWPSVAASPQIVHLKQRSGENIDQLFKNSQGQAPCDLVPALAAPCTSNFDITSPTPTGCTCNNVFFNVRSACLLSEGGSSSAPKYDDWHSACQQASIDVTTGFPSKYVTNSNTPPFWAFVAINSGGYFDYSAAVDAAKPRDWTMLQIMLPIISVAVTLLFGLLAFLLLKYRSSLRTILPLSSRNWFKSRSPARIQTTTKSDSWTIDRSNSSSGDNVDMASYPNVEYGSSHIRMHSAESFKILDKPFHDEPETIRSNSPRAWDRFAQTIKQLPEQLQMPFKPKAVGIQEAEPTRRFRVDSVDASSAGHSLSSGRRSSRRGGRSTVIADLPARWRGLINENDRFPGSSEGPTSVEEEEEESLISHSERSENHVYLITNRNTANFSNESSGISSNIVKIEPPTPTASSRDSARQSGPPGPPPLAALPPIPPPPRIPPPSPPSFAPRLSPIPQGGPSQESLQTSSISSHTTPRPIPTKQPSADSIQMSVLSPSSTSALSYPGHHHHTRSNSGNSGGRRIGRQKSTEENDDTSSIRARPMGARSPARSVRQLSVDETTEPGTPNPNAYTHAQGHPAAVPRPQHWRSHSGGDEVMEDDQFQPLAVPFMHRRNLSNESITPAPGDPIRLFPGAVRSAGYGTHMTETTGSFYSTPSMDISMQQPRPAPAPSPSPDSFYR